MKILFVCLGNICRSPIAEGVMKKLLKEKSLTWQIESAGTNGFHTGEAPHKLSQKVCKEHNIDISAQRSRNFVDEDFLHFDMIYVMAADVLRDVRNIASKHYDENKIDFFLNALYPNSNKDVYDPWYGTEEDYYEVYDQIYKTCLAIKKFWES